MLTVILLSPPRTITDFTGLISIEGYEGLYEVSATDNLNEYVIKRYQINDFIGIKPLKDPQVREKYKNRKVPVTHRCTKARPLQQEYG